MHLGRIVAASCAASSLAPSSVSFAHQPFDFDQQTSFSCVPTAAADVFSHPSSVNPAHFGISPDPVSAFDAAPSVSVTPSVTVDPSVAISDVLGVSLSQATSGIPEYQATGLSAPVDDSDDSICSFVSASEYPLGDQSTSPATPTVQQDPPPGDDSALSSALSSRSPSRYQATVHTASSGESNDAGISFAPASSPTEQPSVAPGRVGAVDISSQCSVPPLSASAIDSPEHPTAAATVEPVRHVESPTSEPTAASKSSASGWRRRVDWRSVRDQLGSVSQYGTIGLAASKFASVKKAYEDTESAVKTRYGATRSKLGTIGSQLTSKASEAYQSISRIPRVHPSGVYSRGRELFSTSMSRAGGTLKDFWRAAPPEPVKEPSFFDAISSRARSAYDAGVSRFRKEDIPEEEKSGWLSYLTGSSRAPVQPETTSRWSSFSLRRKPVETAPQSGQSWISRHTPSIKSIIPPSWTGDEVAEVMTADDSWMAQSRDVVTSAMGSVSAQSQAMSEYIQKQTDMLKEYTGIIKPAPEPESTRLSRWRSRRA
jgi:hypothetical protein